MKYQKLMTAILTDGSQITGAELSNNMRSDEIILINDGCETPISMSLCVSYFEAVDPSGFDELTLLEATELEKLENLPCLLMRESY